MPRGNRTPQELVALHGAPLIIAVIVLSSANFVAILDINVVAVAIPYIAGRLAVSPDEATWAITSYAVAEAVVVPLTGWLTTRFGTVRVFLIGVIGFGVASLLCGLAANFPLFLLCRVLQGLTGAPLIPASQALVMRISPPDKQNATMGLWSMTTIAGPVAGPFIGGVLNDAANWRWAFYVNVPLVALCALLVWRTMRGKDTPTARVGIDYVGLVLLTVWVAALQVMLDNGQKLDWFQSNFIVTIAIVAAVAFIAFVGWELTDENPIVDLHIFRNRTFTVALITLFLTFGGFVPGAIITPLWLQTNLGYSATVAGEVIAMTAVLGVLISPIAATLMSRVDSRLLICVGALLLSATTLYRVGFNQEMTFWQLAGAQLMIGVSFPFWFLPIMSMSIATLKPEQTAAAAGLANFIRILTLAVGIAISTTYWINDTARSHAILVGRLHRPDLLVATLEQLGSTSPQALQSLDDMVQSQSVMLATNHLYLAAGLMLTMAAGIVWLMPKPTVAASIARE